MYNRETLLVQVAMMYYEQNMTQMEIANELGMSRPTIATLLKEAKDANVVQIRIVHTHKNVFEKQIQLQKKYNTRSIHIASLDEITKNAKEAVGRLCASYLSSIIHEVHTIGIGWGTTLAEFVNAFEAPSTPPADVHIIPLIGGMGYSNTKLHSNHLSFILAEKLKATVEFLYAPAIAQNDEIYEMTINSPMIKRVLQKGKSCDVAIVGVGNPYLSSNYERFNIFTAAEIQELKNKHAIGDMLSTFFDHNGNEIVPDFPKRLIGLSLEDLAKVDNIIALATGSEKAEAVDTLLKNNTIKTLFIDEDLADELLIL